MGVVRHFHISNLFVILLIFIMWRGGGGEGRGWSLHIYSNNKLLSFNGPCSTKQSEYFYFGQEFRGCSFVSTS